MRWRVCLCVLLLFATAPVKALPPQESKGPPLPPGTRGLDVACHVEGVIADAVLVGSRVDVIVTARQSWSTSKARFVAGNVLVVAVRPAEGQPGRRTVTVAVTPEQGRALCGAVRWGDASLVLRRPDDGGERPVPAAVPGPRAVAVRVSPETLAAQVRPGTRVDVLTTRGGRAAPAKVLIQDAAVLAVDALGGGDGIPPTTVTLRLTNEQAQSLMAAVAAGAGVRVVARPEQADR